MKVISNQNYALVLHGGAGARLGRDYTAVEDHLHQLAETGRKQLADSVTALDVIEDAVAEMEASGLYVAGRGSAPNTAGYVELDASIMDGATRAAGSVASIRNVVHPVRIARRVMQATPHVLLAGAGALSFAREQGFEEVSEPDSYYCLPVGVTADETTQQMHGTVGAVALDSSGNVAAATSTGGTFGKLEGRVGDSPLIGAGTWADDEIAISCTGTGEHIIRAGGAVSIACNVRNGAHIDDAIGAMLDEVKRLGGEAGVIAVTSSGRVATAFNSKGLKRAFVSASEALSVATF